MGRKRVFIDTSAWYALQITDDANHQRAVEIFPHLLTSYENLLTSNHVAGETYTLLRVTKGYDEAKRFLDILRQSPRVEEYTPSHQIEKNAFELLHKFRDHTFSFIDAVSFCIMHTENIQDAFAFDVHFRIAGFNRVGIDIPI